MIVETAYAADGVTLVRTVDVEPDGTGTITTYNSDGTVASTTTLTGVDIPATPIDPLHQLAQAIVDATTLDDIKPVALAILTDGDTP